MTTTPALFQQNPGVIASDVDSNIVIMNLATGDYTLLKETGAAIWRLLGSPLNMEALTTQLAGQFDVDVEQCLADTQAFVDDLLAKDLLTQH